MADELTARVYFRRAELILDRVEQSLLGGAARTNLLLEAATNALLAVGMGLGVHLPPLPTLDRYCTCPLTPRGEIFTHAADCPKRPMTDAEAEALKAALSAALKPTNDEGPAASPTGPNA